MTAVRPVKTWFTAGDQGQWRVERTWAVVGEGLTATPERLAVSDRSLGLSESSAWVLVGTTSHERYTRRTEHDLLAAQQPDLGRVEARQAALLPIRKNADWWGLAQDERRNIMAVQSRHITTGMQYLPAVARRLYHCRDLGGPFDFLTWFEFANSDAAAFDHLLHNLRQTQEWSFVDREVEIRLSREP